MSKIMRYVFEVECLEAGQRHSYGDSFYNYTVTSDLSEAEVKTFCMNILGVSFEKKDMPSAFSGQLLEFVKLTDNNKGKGFLDKKEPEQYRYKYMTLYTG